MKALLFQLLHSTLIPSTVLRKTTKQCRATSIDWWGPDFLLSNMSIGLFGSCSPSFLDVGWGTELADWCYILATPITVSSLILANTMPHHDGHNKGPSWWPLQYSIKTAIAVSLKMAIIVILTFAIMLAIYNHDCWHHHNHDITQNLAEKFFHCDSGHDNSDGAIVISVVVAFWFDGISRRPWKGENDKCSIILKALHACHFVFAFGEWVNKSDIYANISWSSFRLQWSMNSKRV